MKINCLLKNILLKSIILVSFCFISCRDINILDEDNNNRHDAVTRALYNNSFNWENTSTVTMTDLKGRIVSGIPLPWVLGAPTAGIPYEWIDRNDIESTNYSDRMYTRQNYWELIYSNVATPSSFKYIVLYNKISGILRCFYYVFADAVNPGTTNCIWGIGINGSTSLFNFTSLFANDNTTMKSYPTYISSPQGTFTDSKFDIVGYGTERWYGIEMECAYDPQLAKSTSSLFLLGRAVNKIKYTGDGLSTGNIDGTITGTASNNSSLNLSFSNMFNSNKDNSISISQNSALENVGDKIDEGVKKKNSFFTSLWGNIKGNASKWITSGLELGVKEGMKAIVSGGANVVVGALSNVFSSITGGGKPSVSHVDLKLQLSSKYQFESEQSLAGWADVTLAIPGQTNYVPILYSGELGVWNLSKKPCINFDVTHIEVTENGIKQLIGSSTIITYSCNEDPNIVILNPEIRNNFKVVNFSCRPVFPTAEVSEVNYGEANYAEPMLVNNEAYYVRSSFTQKYEELYNPAPFGYGLVEIKFNLSNINDSIQTYSYKKIFRASFKLLSEKTEIREIGKHKFH